MKLIYAINFIQCRGLKIYKKNSGYAVWMWMYICITPQDEKILNLSVNNVPASLHEFWFLKQSGLGEKQAGVSRTQTRL